MPSQHIKPIYIIIVIAILITIIVLAITSSNQEKETSSNVESNKVEEQEPQNVEEYVAKRDDGTKINNSNELKSNKKYKDLEISNIKFTYQEEKSTLLAEVKNTASTKHEAEIVKIIILDKENKVISEEKIVMPSLEPEKVGNLNAIISGDVVNAKDFKIEEIEK